MGSFILFFSFKWGSHVPSVLQPQGVRHKSDAWEGEGQDHLLEERLGWVQHRLGKLPIQSLILTFNTLYFTSSHPSAWSFSIGICYFWDGRIFVLFQELFNFWRQMHGNGSKEGSNLVQVMVDLFNPKLSIFSSISVFWQNVGQKKFD